MIATSSLAGLLGHGQLGVYTASKFGVVGLMESLRFELADSNIAVTVFCPGIVSSNLGLQLCTQSSRGVQGQSTAAASPRPAAGARSPTMAAAMDPLEAGERVLKGMRNNDLYVLTTPDFEEDFRARGEAIVASVPTDVTPSAERVALGHRIAGKMTYVAERDRKQCERKARTAREGLDAAENRAMTIGQKASMRTIEVGDLKLGYRCAGDPHKQGPLLLHGWPHSSALYAGVLEDLGRDFYAIAPDLPDVGASRGALPSAQKHVLADIVLTMAERLQARETVVVGLDVGGMIAFSAAREQGHRIIGAVVANTVIPGLHPWTEVISDPRIWHFALHAIPKLPETLVSGRQRAYFDFFFDALAKQPERLTDEIRNELTRAYERAESLKAGVRLVSRIRTGRGTQSRAAAIRHADPVSAWER